MEICWDQDPDRRMSFDEIVEELQAYISVKKHKRRNNKDITELDVGVNISPSCVMMI